MVAWLEYMMKLVRVKELRIETLYKIDNHSPTNQSIQKQKENFNSMMQR